MRRSFIPVMVPKQLSETRNRRTPSSEKSPPSKTPFKGKNTGQHTRSLQRADTSYEYQRFRRGMEEQTYTRTVQGPEKEGDGAGIHRETVTQQGEGRLHVRCLWSRTFRIRRQIRLGIRLAQFLGTVSRRQD